MEEEALTWRKRIQQQKPWQSPVTGKAKESRREATQRVIDDLNIRGDGGVKIN
jgi:hypothetical protein